MAWYKPWDKQGNQARERRRGEIAERQAAEAATQDPYGPNAPQWDASGFPVGPMPKGKYALDYQYEANRRAEQRRQVLWGDAQGAMRQGESLLSSYRPGGSAALASNIYGQRGGMYATQALNTSAPDLLIDWREQIRARAEEKADELNRNAQLITGLSALNPLAGGTPTTMTQQPDQPGPQASPGGGGTYNVGAGGEAAPGGPSGGVSPGGPTTPMPATTVAGQPAGSPGVLPGLLLPQQRTIGGGSAVDVLDAGGGGGAGPGGPGGGGARGGGRGMDAAGAGATAMGGGGGGGLGDFSGPAVANYGMSQSPASADIAASVWAEDPQREQSTALMVQSARQVLLDAIAIG